MQFPKSGHLVVSTASDHIAVQSRHHIVKRSKKLEILYPGSNNLFVYESLESLHHTQNVVTLVFYCSVDYDYRWMKFVVCGLIIK